MERLRIQEPVRASPLCGESQEAAEKCARLAPLLTVNDGLQEVRERSQLGRFPVRVRAERCHSPEILVVLVGAQVLTSCLGDQWPEDAADDLGLDRLTKTNDCW